MEIFEIQANYRKAFDSLEIDEETGEVLSSFDKLHEIEALEGQWADKLEAMALYTKELTALAADIKAERDKLTKRMKSIENSAEWFKSEMTAAMDGMRRDKFETARTRLSFRRSESVNITNEAALSEEYLTTKVTTSPNKTAIKEAIKKGLEVKGAELCTNRNLQIK